jgi:predicted O-linked N-acetylglucosamine transferase (SPINDLY family)
MAIQQYLAPSCSDNIRAQCDAYIARQKIGDWGQNWTAEVANFSDIAVHRHPTCVIPSVALFSQWADPLVPLEISKHYSKIAELKSSRVAKLRPLALDQPTIALLEALSSKSGAVNSTTRIKIGYISSYFYNHIVGLIMEHLLPRHNKERFEIYAYALNKEKGTLPLTESSVHTLARYN